MIFKCFRHLAFVSVTTQTTDAQNHHHHCRTESPASAPATFSSLTIDDLPLLAFNVDEDRALYNDNNEPAAGAQDDPEFCVNCKMMLTTPARRVCIYPCAHIFCSVSNLKNLFLQKNFLDLL